MLIDIPGSLLRAYLPWQQLAQPSGQQVWLQPSGQQLPQTAAFVRRVCPNPTTVKASMSERQAIVRFIKVSFDFGPADENHTRGVE
jgi:hypothetical protein